jgi:hypothetical protein
MLPAISLWLIPLVVVVVSRRAAPARVWRNTGIAFGLVVAPASLGLYGLYHVGPIAALFGLLGLALDLLHGPPGYNLAIALGLIPSESVITDAMRIPAETLNALVWSPVYGALGWFIDTRRAQRHSRMRDGV